MSNYELYNHQHFYTTIYTLVLYSLLILIIIYFDKKIETEFATTGKYIYIIKLKNSADV